MNHPDYQVTSHKEAQAWRAWAEAANDTDLLAALQGCGNTWQTVVAGYLADELVSRGYRLVGAWPSEVTLERQEEQEVPDWRAIDAKAKAALEVIQTDQDAYTFIELYLSKELRAQLVKIYRSDRHEMGRSPRQAIENLLSLPPL